MPKIFVFMHGKMTFFADTFAYNEIRNRENQKKEMILLILYADVLFAVNFIMDYLALYAASAVLRLGKGRVRMACGALIGAAYCIIKIYVSFFEPLAAIFVSLVMCFAALWNGKILTYIKAVILFYAVSMLFGGVMTFLYESVRRYRSAPLFRDGLTPGLFFAAVGILFVFIFAGSLHCFARRVCQKCPRPR